MWGTWSTILTLQVKLLYLLTPIAMKKLENYFKILVVAHNLFKFDFFFLLKGLRAGTWKTQDINIGGRNPSDINFASIGTQIQFINTIKYFQQSLAALANSLTDKEKKAIYEECQKSLYKDSTFSQTFLLCTAEEKKWVLDYLLSGKGTISYELITQYDSLDIVPDVGNFFLLSPFLL